jgi:hypothetical protein
MTPHEDALALDRVVVEYLRRWWLLMPDVTVTARGAGWAARTPSAPDVDFLNGVHGLAAADAGLVPEIVAGYRAAGVPRPWFELMPEADFEPLAGALAAAGARHVSFLVVLERDPAPVQDDLPAGVDLREVGEDDPDFVRVMPAGHGVPAEHLAEAMERTRLSTRIAGTRRYVATVAGEPAAAAVLLLLDGIAYLANAATLEPARRRGCQGALIRRRLADGAAAGCRRACVITGWGSQSHANLVRAGFRTAYNKAVWRLDDGTPVAAQ